MTFLYLFFSVCFFLFLLSFIGIRGWQSDVGKLFLFFSVFLCAIVIGTRYNIGGDFSNYVELFNTVSASDFGFGNRFSYEYGYYALVMILRNLEFGSQSFFILSALLTLFLFSLLFKKREWLLPVGLLVFMLCTPFKFSINGIRQSIAIFAFLNGVCYIYKEKSLFYRFFHFAIWVLVASMFHETAFIYLIVFPLLSNRYVKNINGWMLVAVAASGFLLNILGITDRIYYESGMKDYNPILRYLDDERFVLEHGKFGLGSYLTLFAYLFIIGYYNKIKSVYPESAPFFILLAFGLFIKYMLPGNMFANRIAYYFIFGEVLVIPYFIHYQIKQKCRHSKVLVPLFILWYIVLFLFDYPEFLKMQVERGASFCGILI